MIRKVAFDMDGVLCDFIAGATNAGILDPETGKIDKEKLLESDSRFWESLPAIVEGLWLYSRLYAFSKRYDLKLYILTHSISDSARLGKKEWLEKNLKTNPMDIVMVARREDKSDFADKETLLIDDYDKNCEAFRNAGGFAVQFNRSDMKKTRDEISEFLKEIV